MSTFRIVCGPTIAAMKRKSRNSFRRKFIIAFCLSDSENNFGTRRKPELKEKIVRDMLYWTQFHCMQSKFFSLRKKKEIKTPIHRYTYTHNKNVVKGETRLGAKIEMQRKKT